MMRKIHFKFSHAAWASGCISAALMACSTRSGSPAATLLAQANMGPDGGTLQSADGVRVDVPAGAVGQITSLTISRLSDEPAPADTTPLSAAYVLGPEGTTFNKTLQVTVPFDASRTPSGAGGVLLFRASASGGDWVSMGGQISGSTITAATPGLSKWQAGWYSYGCAFTIPDGPLNSGSACYLRDSRDAGVDCVTRGDPFSVPDVAVWAKNCSCSNGNPPAGPYATWLCYAPHMAWIYKNYCGLSCKGAVSGCSSGCNPVGSWSLSGDGGTCALEANASVQIASTGPGTLSITDTSGRCNCDCAFSLSFDSSTCSASGSTTASCDGGTLAASLNVQFCGDTLKGSEHANWGGAICDVAFIGTRK